MRHRQPWSLYKRKSGKLTVWYYRTYDEFGQRTTGRSTGQTTKTQANSLCAQLFKEGRLVPTADILFSAYAETWWKWGECAYLRARLDRSAPGRPRVSQRYAYEMRRILELNLIPAFGRYRLSAIAPRLIETWMFRIRDGGLSGKRINDMLGCLRVMLGEAFRQGRIVKNPFAIVRPLGTEAKKRGLLTAAEARELFLDANLPTIWNGHQLHRAVNLVAASTGCRQGEILALQDPDVRDGWLHIEHSWHPKWKLGPTKTRTARDVPVPSRVLGAIRPFTGSGGYVFSINGGTTPIGKSAVNDALYAALQKIGISETDRKARGLTFHSWRHWLNSMLRAHSVADPLVRRVTGHSTAEMTERYTSFLREDFAPVLAVQEEVLG